MVTRLFVCVCMWFSSSAIGFSDDGQLQVTVSNIPAATKQVTLVLFSTPTNFENAQKTKMVSQPRAAWRLHHSYADARVNRGQANLKIPAMPLGEYTAMVFCDENANGILDKSRLGMPVEAIGMSNMQPPKSVLSMKRPTWESTKFRIQPGDNELQIQAFRIGF